MLFDKKKWVLALAALGLLGTAMACAPEAEDFEDAADELAEELPDESSEALTTTSPLFGLYHWDAPRGPALVDAVGSWIGRAPELAVVYGPAQSWTAMRDLGWQLPAWSNWVRARTGRQLVYSLPMLPGPANRSGPDGTLGTADDVSLAACARGNYDSHWRAIAGSLVDAGLGKAIVRVGWEFDGDWFAWSARGRELDYAGCFRSVVRAMRSARTNGALRFEWSSSDDIFFASSGQLSALYPGDAYVDLVGVNAYDVSWVPNSYPLPTSCDARCASARRLTAWNDMMRGVYRMRDFAKAHNKQLAIPEWGLWHRTDGHGGGDNADYVTRMHAFVKDPNNRVYYQAYFDVDYYDGAHQLSDVSGSGLSTSVGHTYKTRFPVAAAKYKALFSVK